MIILAKNISKQEALRIRVYKFFEDNKKFGKMYTVNHFLAEKVPVEFTFYSSDIAKTPASVSTIP